MAHLILASSSPRRRELLQQLGLTFEVYSPDVDESVLDGEHIEDYVVRLARTKAQAVLAHSPNAIVIAADTSLAFAGKILGKAESKQHAFTMWSELSGHWHDVFTGVCVSNATQTLSTVVQTQVQLQLPAAEMEHYWATAEPIGKAGAYAIQGIAAQYIPQIRGSYSNVVGLPLYETAQLLQQLQATH